MDTAKQSITLEDFERAELRAGTALEAKDNKKSRNAAYMVTIDFGEALGIKKSSAQGVILLRPTEAVKNGDRVFERREAALGKSRTPPLAAGPTGGTATMKKRRIAVSKRQRRPDRTLRIEATYEYIC